MVWGQIAGATLSVGGAALGASSQHKARRAAEKRMANESRKLGHQFRQQKKLFGQEMGALNQMYDILGGGYGKAQGAVSNIAQAGYRRVGENLTQNMGSLAAMMPGNSSSLKANLARGLQSDAQRSYGEVDERLAGIRAGLFTGQAEAQAGALGQQANAYRNFGQTRRQYALDRMNIWLGDQTFDTDVYGQLGQAGALVSDAFSNRPGGTESLSAMRRRATEEGGMPPMR